MMISISVAIALDYLAGNFAARGQRVFSGADTHRRVSRASEGKKVMESLFS